VHSTGETDGEDEKEAECGPDNKIRIAKNREMQRQQGQNFASAKHWQSL
jgi:hypothetical protein